MGQRGTTRVQGSISTEGSKYFGPGRELLGGPGSLQYRIHSPWEVSELLMMHGTDSLCRRLLSDPHPLSADKAEVWLKQTKSRNLGSLNVCSCLYRSRIILKQDLHFPQNWLLGRLSSQDKRRLRNVRLRGFSLIPLMRGQWGGGDFPGGSVVKKPPVNAGDLGSIPGLGRSS